MNAFLDMSAQSRSAATLDSQQHFDVQPVQPGPVAFYEAFAMLAKNIGHKSNVFLDGLEPEDLEQLARAGRESWFTQGRALCCEGELGDEVFVLLDGEVSITRRVGGDDVVVAVEGPGSVIGELAVLDPAPREATVVAATVAVRVLRLSGRSFRSALNASPAVSEVIIRMLARRLRAGIPSPPVLDLHV